MGLYLFFDLSRYNIIGARALVRPSIGRHRYSLARVAQCMFTFVPNVKNPPKISKKIREIDESFLLPAMI